jgi:hypothetical protein
MRVKSKTAPSGRARRQSETARRRIKELRDEIRKVDYVCSGTLHRRTKVCGKPTCRCAVDREARHGPYYEWSRLESGRLVHRLLTEEQAELLLRAIGNYRRVQRLLRHWEDQTLRVADVKPPKKP